ncbi:MAG: glutaredoxin family protein [Burkholderiaceae bacterium]|jgi:glutaredoxin|nr:glutaredoxin family protein [Burkholderiaceae bacterium]
MFHRYPVSALTVALLLTAGAAQAQLYRSVGADGTVTYSDKPPVNAAPSRSAPAADADQASSNGSALPYDLAQVAGRYPVTLYTTKECAPCDQGRNLLARRGIPFTEKTVNTNDDIAALKRLGGDGNLPMLTIGGQRLGGFSEADWSQYLDAASYPKTSQRPGGYQRPAATPLVAIQLTPADQTGGDAGTANAPASGEPVSPTRRTADNPAGIRF